MKLSDERVEVELQEVCELISETLHKEVFDILAQKYNSPVAVVLFLRALKEYTDNFMIEILKANHIGKELKRGLFDMMTQREIINKKEMLKWYSVENN